MNKTPNILFYDIETAPLKAWVWQCGKQVLRHHQLDKDHNQPRIICVTYSWLNENRVHCIDWGYEEQSTAKVVVEFDEIIKQADMTIGKNSNRFDTKMINAARMLNGLPGIPEWTKYTDDLEVQMRRYFRLPSQSLDYISQQLGLGGKIKMEFQDWIDIVEKNDNGKKAFAKMLKYGKKDTADLKTIWKRLSEHFDSKWDQAEYLGERLSCKHMDCGSKNLYMNGTRISGKTTYQMYNCSDCKRYAGRTPLSKVNKVEGKIR